MILLIRVYAVLTTMFFLSYHLLNAYCFTLKRKSDVISGVYIVIYVTCGYGIVHQILKTYIRSVLNVRSVGKLLPLDKKSNS